MPAYDSATALVIVDVQNDFADPAGGLSVRGGDAVVPVINGQVALARASGAEIVYTADWHPATTPHFAKDGGPWPVHCVMGTWGAQLHPGLVVDGPVVHKGANGEDGYSGFTMRDPFTGEDMPTALDDLLRLHGVRRVVLCGLATDYCVVATALDARRLGYETQVLVDAIAAVDVEEGDGARALQEMEGAGVELIHT